MEGLRHGLLSFAAGLLITRHLITVKAASNCVFELRLYHTLPGKVLELKSRFRDTART